MFCPQHRSVPSCSRAHVCHPPADTPTAPLIPLTTAGDDEFTNVPVPSCPESFNPQHRIVPSASSAHVWNAPVVTDIAFVIPLTLTGVVDVSVITDGFPNCWYSFRPQHCSVPFGNPAHV